MAQWDGNTVGVDSGFLASRAYGESAAYPVTDLMLVWYSTSARAGLTGCAWNANAFLPPNFSLLRAFYFSLLAVRESVVVPFANASEFYIRKVA